MVSKNKHQKLLSFLTNLRTDFSDDTSSPLKPAPVNFHRDHVSVFSPANNTPWRRLLWLPVLLEQPWSKPTDFDSIAPGIFLSKTGGGPADSKLSSPRGNFFLVIIL
jgi:hypothetical protein